uniref:F5/8 type C domain-containing protein n=1 Tax=Burkholderia phage vB_BgluM-SURPRISE13 TaxID=3159457 RepID=A0AAU7PF77_9VIRU
MHESMLLKKKSVAAGSYRYVKLNHITANGTQYNCVTIGEIQMFDSTGSTNWCRQSGVIATASGFYHDGVNPDQVASQAIDGILDTSAAHRWTSNPDSRATNFSTTPFWFLLDFGVARAIDSVKLALISGNGQDPVHFTIEGSNDGSSFTVFKEVNRGVYVTNTFTEVLAV